MRMRWNAVMLIAGSAAGLLLSACGTSLPETTSEGRHLIPPEPVESAEIPQVVGAAPLVPEPEDQAPPDLYSVSAQDVPVRELLFAMARDAAINIDVHPGVMGQVSINAIDQTLPQILERISRQVAIRWSFDENGNLLVEPDTPYWQAYRVDYVNVQRTSTTEASVSTAIVNLSGTQTSVDANNSSSSITQNATNAFWDSLAANLITFLGQDQEGGEDQDPSLVVNPDSGIVNVRATSVQHQQVQAFLNFVETRSLQQVLIEATVVEVDLNDRYQAGVDWQTINQTSDEIDFAQNVTGTNLAQPPVSVLTLNAEGPDGITATMRLLSQFGDLQVLSSPKVMALNNQTAMLRVVDNTVYFTIEVQPGIPPSGVSPGTPPVFTTNVHTVPVGFVMTVTPQIGENDQVTLNVRPTISRIVRFVNDPNPILADTGVVNSVPEVQIREIDSVLKVFSGQIAILGGLMQDSLQSNVDGVPILSRIPGVRNLFSFRDESAGKTELIVFIRPVIVRQPSLAGDLRQFRNFLPPNGLDINNFFRE